MQAGLTLCGEFDFVASTAAVGVGARGTCGIMTLSPACDDSIDSFLLIVLKGLQIYSRRLTPRQRMQFPQ